MIISQTPEEKKSPSGPDPGRKKYRVGPNPGREKIGWQQVFCGGCRAALYHGSGIAREGGSRSLTPEAISMLQITFDWPLGSQLVPIGSNGCNQPDFFYKPRKNI